MRGRNLRLVGLGTCKAHRLLQASLKCLYLECKPEVGVSQEKCISSNHTPLLDIQCSLCLSPCVSLVFLILLFKKKFMCSCFCKFPCCVLSCGLSFLTVLFPSKSFPNSTQFMKPHLSAHKTLNVYFHIECCGLITYNFASVPDQYLPYPVHSTMSCPNSR